VLFGLAPALIGARRDLGEALRRTGLSVTGGTGRLRRALVVAEVALTVMLLVGAGLLWRSFTRLQAVDPGVDTRNVVTMQLSLPEARYPDDKHITGFYDTLLERVESLPGVEAAGIGMSLPPHLLRMSNPYTVEGRPSAGAPPLAQEVVISPDFLRALGVSLQRGRWFDARDAGKAPLVLLVNQTMARKSFGADNPLGRRLQTGDPSPESPWETIVGVVGDVRYDGLDAIPEPTLYAPYRAAWWPWFSRSMYLVVRSPQSAESVTSGVRRAIAALDPELPIANVKTLQQVVESSVAPQRFRTVLMGLFAAAALILALVGIYALLAHTVTQKTVEIGVRMALGARARQVVVELVGHGLRLTLIGVAIGLAGAFALGRLVQSLLYGVTPVDAPSYLFAAGVVIATALVAGALPARRASRVDPLIAMRSE
jgi:putative ABC transport system permease protein